MATAAPTRRRRLKRSVKPRPHARERINLAADPAESAKLAQLRYVGDEQPGIRRKKSGQNFTYYGADGGDS